MRFCVEEFDVSRLHDQFVHLSNNSIQKKSAKFNDTDIEGNMISSGHFQELLLRAEGSSERWTDVILPQMKQVVRWSLMAAQEQVGDRENSFELFGYDFMIDELDNVQLIEINSRCAVAAMSGGPAHVLTPSSPPAARTSRTAPRSPRTW